MIDERNQSKGVLRSGGYGTRLPTALQPSSADSTVKSSEHKTLVFFGNERLATGLGTTAPTLRALITAGYEITGVIVAQNEMSSSRKSRELEIVQVANTHNIRVLSPKNLGESVDEIAEFGAEIGVLVAYGKIVPQSIIDLFPHGIINIHPSLLPLHRGSTPIESVILNDDTETGVSVMSLSAGMDSGPVYGQSIIQLMGDETKQELADQLLNIGKDMVIEFLPSILDGSMKAFAQDETLATYDKMIDKSVSLMDWNKSAVQLEREVRAYAIWPRSRTSIDGIEVIITESHVIDGVGKIGTIWKSDKELGFYTTDGILAIDRLIPLGKKEMDITSFLAGYSIK